MCSCLKLDPFSHLTQSTFSTSSYKHALQVYHLCSIQSNDCVVIVHQHSFVSHCSSLMQDPKMDYWMIVRYVFMVVTAFSFHFTMVLILQQIKILDVL